MRMHELLPYYLEGVREVVDLSPAGVDLREALRAPGSLPWHRPELADLHQHDLGPGTLLLDLLGPDPEVHHGPAALGPVFGQLREGARAVLLIGWPIDQFPYHHLLGPLGAGHCQVRDTVPLERATVGGGCHCAVVAERVARLAPLRSYLTDLPESTWRDVDPPSDTTDELRTILRVVNEYTLSELVTRPIRQRLVELENQQAQLTTALTRTAELSRTLAEREAAMGDLYRLLAEARARVAVLESVAGKPLPLVVAYHLRRTARRVVGRSRRLARSAMGRP